MFSLKKVLTSGLARKLVNGVTAIGLVLFVIAHLAGNLALYSDSGEEFNAYGHFLHTVAGGKLLPIAEVGLFIFFAFHALTGLNLWWKNRKARGSRYAGGQKTKKGPSKMNVMSKSMAWTGSILAIFVVVHVLHFRIAAWYDTAEYTTTIDGEKVIDLYGMVETAFANPLWVAFYCGAMFFLGWHLRHGVWSMLQTISAMNSRWSKPLYAAAALVAVLLAAGFFFIPIYMYFF